MISYAKIAGKRFGAAMKRSLIGVLPLMVLLFAFSVYAEPLRLSTLEWPPFVGQDLPDQGATSARVRSICAVAGLEPHLSFLPWKRVLMEARTGLAQGYFPEYRSVDRETEFYFSKAVGCSVVGLVHRRDMTLDWTRLEDLSSYRLGVVDGYVNTEEFDRLVDMGILFPVKCNSDEMALRMLGPEGSMRPSWTGPCSGIFQAGWNRRKTRPLWSSPPKFSPCTRSTSVFPGLPPEKRW